MKWEDFKKQELAPPPAVSKVKTDIECPRCNKYLWQRLDRILPSNPPKYQYECDCGFVGYHNI